MKRIPGIMMLCCLLGCANQPPATAPALGSKEWTEAVERIVVTGDKDGGGPDVGSDEWKRVVSKKIHVYDAQGHGPDLGSPEWCRAVHRKVFHAEPAGAVL